MADAADHAGHRPRLRERFLAAPEALPDYELLELFLFQAKPRKDMKPLAKALLRRFGSFAAVIAADPAELKSVDGVGDRTVAALKTIHEAARRLARDGARTAASATDHRPRKPRRRHCRLPVPLRSTSSRQWRRRKQCTNIQAGPPNGGRSTFGRDDSTVTTTVNAITAGLFANDTTINGGNGTIAIAGDVTTTGQDVTFDGQVQITANLIITTAGGDIGLIGDITGSAAALNLSLQAGAGDITVAGNIGSTGTRLGTVTANTSGDVAFQGSLTAGALTLANSSIVTVSGAVTLSGTVANVAFLDGVIAGSASLANTGSLQLGNASGDTTTVTAGLNTTSVGGVVSLGGTIGTTNTALTTGAIALNVNTVMNAGSGAITIGTVTGGGHDLTVQGSGTATIAAAADVGTLAFAKTGGTASVTGNLSATGLTTAANNYGVALTGATTTVTNATVFTNTGAVVLGDGGDQLTFAGGLNTAAAGSTSIGGTVATTNTALNAGSSVVTTGALNAGAHDITIVVDGITLTGNWTGTGSWTLQPGTASTTVGLAGAAGQFSLDATELARLANATAAQVTVGRSDGTGAVTANGFSFDDALTLRGGPILLQGVLNKPAGALILSSTGAVVGTVNLAAETGVLKVGGVSAALTGTVDGLGDIAAASRTVLVGVPGTGPFTINGQSFQILAVPVPPVVPATQAAAVTAVVQVLAAVKSTAASPSGGSGAGSSDTGAASQALTGGSATSQPYAVQVSFDQFSLSAPSGVALADTSTAAGGDAPAQVNPMDEAVGDANDFLENFRGQ